jgi:hypothetical protein
MTRLVEVKALAAYQIWLRFEDGLEGVIDLTPLVGKGVFQQLADERFFVQVYIDLESRTVAWPGGIDLCPDTLYQDILAQQQAA